MKYKLINKTSGEEHLCEKVVIDGWDYYTLPSSVIATNNQNIDISKVVHEVEILADAHCKEWNFERVLGNGSNTLAFDSFVYGYNKSQETHPFSEEDMIEFAEWLTLNTNSTSIHGEYIYKNVRRVTKELIQIWKEQRTKKLYYE